MKKILILSLLVLAAGVVGQGCVYMDHPSSQFAGNIHCEDACGGYENAAGMMDFYMLTAGVDPEIEGGAGGYYGVIQNIDTGASVGCDLWGGAGGYTASDTYFNRADGLMNGCPPGFDCLTGAGVPLFSQFGANCFNQSDLDALTLSGTGVCGSFNGECGNQGWIADAAYSIDPGPGAYEFQPFYRCLDKTPGQPYEFDLNMVRAPGNYCEACGAAAPVPDDCEALGKVLMCHIPRGNPDNAHEICIGASAVPAHLAHGDSEGSCGGGPGGPGFQLPAGNNAPLWALGYGFGIDFTFQTVGQLPWTDDWNNGQGPVQGASMDQARAQLLQLLSGYSPDADGMSSLSIASITAHGETYTLSEPFDVKLGVEILPSGRMTYRAMTPDRHMFREIAEILVNNTPEHQALDLSGWKLTLGDGQVVPGAIITRSLQGQVVLNHDGLLHYANQALEPLSNGLNDRLDTIRTSR